MRFPQKYLVHAALAAAVVLCLLVALGAAALVESRSASAVRTALAAAGHDWVKVEPNGLQIILTGTAPSEAKRFNALSIAGAEVDSARLRDRIQVADSADAKAPEFRIEILRNDDGISLIGLVPATTDRAALVEDLAVLAGEGKVTDMLEAADYPSPENWSNALAYALESLRMLPRAKVSADAGRVAITAITDTPAEKARLETTLARKAPSGVRLSLDISAPHPVITPFTLRFLAGPDGSRFDACSADTEAARDRIVAAATKAGATGQINCTVGLGVPTPEWADAVTMGIAAVSELGAASITFSDADVSLVAEAGVTQAAFDKVVGELESNLPEVFSLQARMAGAEGAATDQGPPEFSATLSADGSVQLRGRVPDELTRDAVDSFARARFGASDVHAATRLDSGLPDGWPLRVLTALDALGELDNGAVTVQPDNIRIVGVSGAKDASDRIARTLSAKLGEAASLSIEVRYDAKLDPLAGLPTAEECMADINAALRARKITFEPGSATITREADATLDKIAALMKNCADFPMEVAGHTDSQGREEMNLALSQDRAQAVIAALQARRALTGNLKAQGYGETRPIGDNETEAGREQNRRIEVTLIGAPAPASGAGMDEAASGEAGEAAAAPDGSILIQTPGKDTIRPAARPRRDGDGN